LTRRKTLTIERVLLPTPAMTDAKNEQTRTPAELIAALLRIGDALRNDRDPPEADQVCREAARALEILADRDVKPANQAEPPPWVWHLGEMRRHYLAFINEPDPAKAAEHVANLWIWDARITAAAEARARLAEEGRRLVEAAYEKGAAASRAAIEAARQAGIEEGRRDGYEECAAKVRERVEWVVRECPKPDGAAAVDVWDELLAIVGPAPTPKGGTPDNLHILHTDGHTLCGMHEGAKVTLRPERATCPTCICKAPEPPAAPLEPLSEAEDIARWVENMVFMFPSKDERAAKVRGLAKRIRALAPAASAPQGGPDPRLVEPASYPSGAPDGFVVESRSLATIPGVDHYVLALDDGDSLTGHQYPTEREAEEAAWRLVWWCARAIATGAPQGEAAGPPEDVVPWVANWLRNGPAFAALQCADYDQPPGDDAPDIMHDHPETVEALLERLASLLEAGQWEPKPPHVEPASPHQGSAATRSRVVTDQDGHRHRIPVEPAGVWRCENGHEVGRLAHLDMSGPCITCGESTTWRSTERTPTPPGGPSETCKPQRGDRVVVVEVDTTYHPDPASKRHEGKAGTVEATSRTTTYVRIDDNHGVYASKVRPESEVCVECRAPIEPGTAKVDTDDGPHHFDCDEPGIRPVEPTYEAQVDDRVLVTVLATVRKVDPGVVLVETEEGHGEHDITAKFWAWTTEVRPAAPAQEDEAEPIEPSALSDLLSLVMDGKHPSPEQAAAWTLEQRAEAEAWAVAESLIASDNLNVERLPRPAWLRDAEVE
jgi:hypothetical protein